MKRYVIYERHADDAEFRPVFGGDFDNREEADARFEQLDDLHGHDTYHQLVEVRRKVLRSR